MKTKELEECFNQSLENSLKYRGIDSDKMLSFSQDGLKYAEIIGDIEKIVKALNSIADSYYEIGDYSESLKYLDISEKKLSNLYYPNLSATIFNIRGSIYKELGNYERSLDNYFKALNIWESLKDKKSITKALNNISVLCLYLDRFNEALEYQKSSLEIKQKDGNEKGIAYSLSNLGLIYFKMGEYSQALLYCEQGLNIFKKRREEINIANSLNNIGEIYLKLHDYKKALKNFLLSLQKRKEEGDKKNISILMINIASLYLKLKDYDKALIFIREGLTIAEKIELKDIMCDGYFVFSEFYIAKNDYKMGYNYFKQYSNLKDKIYNDNLTKKIASLTVQYEVERKNNQLKIYQLENIELKEMNRKLKEANEIINRNSEDLLKAYKKLEFLAKKDPLTKLSNRRDVLNKIEYEKIKFERGRKQFSIIMADIDNFKKFNDIYGHQCGDEILKHISSIFISTLRKQDVIGRWGGEEFIIILPETEKDGAIFVAEKLRDKIELNSLNYKNNEHFITITMGITTYNDSLNTLDYTISVADKALYEGKKTGKNCVVYRDC